MQGTNEDGLPYRLCLKGHKVILLDAAGFELSFEPIDALYLADALLHLAARAEGEKHRIGHRYVTAASSPPAPSISR
jgi:hypothetical protein